MQPIRRSLDDVPSLSILRQSGLSHLLYHLRYWAVLYVNPVPEYFCARVRNAWIHACEQSTGFMHWGPPNSLRLPPWLQLRNLIRLCSQHSCRYRTQKPLQPWFMQCMLHYRRQQSPASHSLRWMGLAAWSLFGSWGCCTCAVLCWTSVLHEPLHSEFLADLFFHSRSIR